MVSFPTTVDLLGARHLATRYLEMLHSSERIHKWKGTTAPGAQRFRWVFVHMTGNVQHLYLVTVDCVFFA